MLESYVLDFNKNPTDFVHATLHKFPDNGKSIMKLGIRDLEKKFGNPGKNSTVFLSSTCIVNFTREARILFFEYSSVFPFRSCDLKLSYAILLSFHFHNERCFKISGDLTSAATIWQIKDDSYGLIEVKGDGPNHPYRFFCLFHKNQVNT